MPYKITIDPSDDPAELLNGPGEPSYSLVAFGTSDDAEQEIELSRAEWLACKETVARLRGYTPPADETEPEAA